MSLFGLKNALGLESLAWLLAHNLDHQPLGSQAVEFGVENVLPWAQVESTGRDGHYDLMMHEHVLEVRVPVVLARAVMPVVTAVRHEVRSDLVVRFLPRGWGQLV
jgi:hypothetical protein